MSTLLIGNHEVAQHIPASTGYKGSAFLLMYVTSAHLGEQLGSGTQEVGMGVGSLGNWMQQSLAVFGSPVVLLMSYIRAGTVMPGLKGGNEQ